MFDRDTFEPKVIDRQGNVLDISYADHCKLIYERNKMNDQIQNNVEQAQEKPAAVLVLDKDGNPVQVQVLGPNEVQDIEYSDTAEGN